MLTYVGFELDNQRKGDDMSNSRYTDSEYYQIDSAGNPTPVVYKPDSDQEGGEGGYGTVFKAQKISSNGHLSEVALKLFIDPKTKKPLMKDSKKLKQEAKGNEAIYDIVSSEIDCVVKPLSSELFCVKDCHENVYFAMDYPWIEGGTLVKLINEWGKKWDSKTKVPKERIQQTCLIVKSILKIFINIHFYKRVHRDIHIGNLAFNEKTNQLWVFDYSLTRSEPSLPELGKSSTKGAPIGYPERARDWLRGHRKPVAGIPTLRDLIEKGEPIVSPQQSDIYAIGNVADSLLTGELTAFSVHQ